LLALIQARPDKSERQSETGEAGISASRRPRVSYDSNWKGIVMKLYVGNLSYEAGEPELRELFGAYGTVDSVAVITDRETGRSKGFGFVEFGNDAEAQAAISGLNGKEVSGRALTVSLARPKSDSGGNRGGGYNSGGSGRRNRY